MKKFFAALLCVAAITLVGCKSDPLATGTKGSKLTTEQIEKMDNTTEKCWHIAARATVNGTTVDEDSYVWCTEQWVASIVKASYEAMVATYKNAGVSYTCEVAYSPSSAKTEEECDKLAEEAQKDK